MDWENLYEKKKASAEEAINLVKSNDRVVVGQINGESFPLVQELANQHERLENVEIVQLNPYGFSACTEEGLEKAFNYNCIFVGPGARKAVTEKRANFTPSFFAEVPLLFKEEILPVDVTILHLSPPDEDGYLSYGTNVDYMEAAAQKSKIVIAEVNKQMPFTYGSKIHISEIDCFIETDRPLFESQRPVLTEVEEKIGENVAPLIQDRANLQLGIGAIPDAILNFLTDKKDLGIHTEMFSDGVVDLFNKGIITSKYNNLNPGILMCCFIMGSKKVYDFINKNNAVKLLPVDYTNHILVAGRVNNLVSINSAIQVDLFGQVCSDTLGYKQFTGVGGQVDFVRAASASEGGKSIIAMPSTTKNNTISKITLKLTEGACVTTSRHDVHYIATEYGVANLKGRTVEERAKMLINIAHPIFREQLAKEACEAGLIKSYDFCTLTK